MDFHTRSASRVQTNTPLFLRTCVYVGPLAFDRSTPMLYVDREELGAGEARPRAMFRNLRTGTVALPSMMGKLKARRGQTRRREDVSRWLV